jgi:hypothetical protein
MPAAAPVAAAFLKSHQVRIARATVRQVQGLVPRYRQVDSAVLEKNIGTLLAGAQVLLERGDDTKLMGMMEYIMQIRTLGGFQTSEFVLACMSFLPVMRRFLFERLPHPQAMEAYEAVEGVSLPFLGRVVSVYEKALESLQEGDTPVPMEIARLWPSRLSPVVVEQVTGGDDEETELEIPVMVRR